MISLEAADNSFPCTTANSGLFLFCQGPVIESGAPFIYQFTPLPAEKLMRNLQHPQSWETERWSLWNHFREL